MNDTLVYLRSRRVWVVENFVVWGSLSAYSGNFLLADETGGDSRVLFWKVDLGGALQEVSYSDLTDHRGNNLPDTIERPKVVVLPKNGVRVVVAGRESNSSFTVAKTEESSLSGLVDLMIFEVGG